MKQRSYSLDIIRILACFMVVLMHSPLPAENANGPFLVALSYFTAPCIGLFFMVSGALLLPVKMDYFTFLKRRLSKIIIPTLIWTAIYLSLNIYFSQSEIGIIHSVLSIPFSAQGNGVLWFIYTLIGLYLLAPILSGWINIATDRELKFVLLLWVITLCYPLISLFADVNTSTTGILYYFTGYAGYFLLGYALKSGRLKISLGLPLMLSLTGVGLLLAIKRYSIEFDFYSLFGYESIIVCALCCAYWIMLEKITSYAFRRKLRYLFGGGITLCVSKLSNLSFGVYLMHILIMRYWLWKTDWVQVIQSYILQTIVIAVATIIITIAICWMLARTPLANILIGYRRR